MDVEFEINNMAQYPIPQFIEAEAKIVSFLTFKQFFALVIAGILAILFYYTLPFILFIILSVIAGIIVAAVAFVKIDNVPVVTMIFNSIMFMTKAKNYTWKKKESSYQFSTRKSQDLVNSAPKISKLEEAKKMIELRKKQ